MQKYRYTEQSQMHIKTKSPREPGVIGDEVHRVTKWVYTGDTICSSSPGWRTERVTKWVEIPLKTLLQYYGKSLEALPGVAYPGFRDNRSTLNTETGYKKKRGKQNLLLIF